jgi:hypothetical protein
MTSALVQELLGGGTALAEPGIVRMSATRPNKRHAISFAIEWSREILDRPMDNMQAADSESNRHVSTLRDHAQPKPLEARSDLEITTDSAQQQVHHVA